MQLRSPSIPAGGESAPATTATAATSIHNIRRKSSWGKHRRASTSSDYHLKPTTSSHPPDQNKGGPFVPASIGANDQRREKRQKTDGAEDQKAACQAHIDQADPSPSSGHTYRLRHSTRQLDFGPLHEWETLDISRLRNGGPIYTIQAVSLEKPTGAKQSHIMSRNRPRGPPTNRDNGIAANEETDMWNKIVQDLRRARERNDRQKSLAEQISALNEKIGREGNKPTLAEINQLDSWYRQVMKLSEEEKAILQEEPSDVIKNLGLLTALRSASEAETSSRAASLPKSSKPSTARDGAAIHAAAASNSALSDKLNRVKGSTQRSSSVSSSGHARDTRDTVSVKVEEGAEGAKGTVAERSGQFVVGAEVVYKHKNKQGVEGEGIQCIIKGISGDGTKKRYDVQDPEPNENGEQGAVYKTSASYLIPIPQVGAALPSFPVGKQVLARYPDTTTFYRAEVMGSKKDVYRLKFEGEEDDKEMEVDRRFVLDVPTR